MSYTYRINYSCCERKLRILLNGRPLPQSSSIMQFIGEPMFRWCGKLPQLMYAELDDNFSVEYSGNTIEAAVLGKIFGDYPHCISFSFIQPVLSQSVQERMIELNKLVVSKKPQGFTPEVTRVCFDGKKELVDKWAEYINELEIKNRICRIDVSISSEKLTEGTKIIIAGSYADAQKISSRPAENDHVFILFENPESGFCYYENGYFAYGFDGESFYDVVFNCLLLFSLSDMVYLCAKKIRKSLHGNNSIAELQKIISTEAAVTVAIPERIECGTSVPLDIMVFPPDAPFPMFDFRYQFEDIISCSQQRIYGKSPGTVQVEVYIKGEYKPLASQVVTVYSRSRISSITLSDYNLTIGINSSHELSLEYLPHDADNADTIKWYSSDEKVASVSDKGFVRAVSLGECTIFCSAEKIFAQCSVKVLPYAEEIVFNGDSSIEEILVPIHGAVPFSMKVYPEDAIDRNIIASSSDLMTANIVGDSIVGLAAGEAVITAENSSRRLRKALKVRVLDEKSMKKEQKKSDKSIEKSKKSIFDIFKGV